MTPEQFTTWAQGLPVVKDRLPFTDLLDLVDEGRVKHVIKPVNSGLRRKAECVLVVLDDSRVFRTVLPSIEGNSRFWSRWDELGVDKVCVNVYSPPVKRLDFPKPYLGFLSRVPVWVVSSFVKLKPQLKKALELKKMREDLKRQRKEELARMREEREMIEKEMRKQKKMDERSKRKEEQRMRYEESVRQGRKNYKEMGKMWSSMVDDPNVTTGLGLFFFYLFYRTVVLNYRKQRKDYEDRIKIEKAEAEERKKMRELERKVQGLEDDEDEDEGKGGEKKPLHEDGYTVYEVWCSCLPSTQ